MSDAIGFTAKTKQAILTFAEELGDKIFVGAAAVYISKGGQINTTDDLKAVAIAGALAGVLWLYGKSKSFNTGS